MIKACLRAAASAAIFLLAACGGGGGGSPNFIQPAPPPPPPPSQFPLTASANFETIAGHLFFRESFSGPATVLTGLGVTGRPSGVTIGYDAAAGTYTVGDGTNTASFSGTPTTSGGIDTYTTTSGSVTNELDLLNNVRAGASQAGAPIALTYLSFGKWTRTDSTSGDQRITYLLFGYPTDTSTMPLTGSASYSTSVTATEVFGCSQCGALPVGGSATFTADFAAGAVNTNLILTNNSGTIGNFQGTGAISANQFSGSFTGTFTENGVVLQDARFAGGFFGPAAAEMGYTFALHRHVLDPFAGAAPNPDSWFTGIVVGKKN